MKPITYHHRELDETQTEQVYGEGFLKWAYGNPLGAIALHGFVKRPFFSHWYGWRMNQPSTQQKINPFIQTYGLDSSEFAQSPESYEHFNAFFYRKLKPSARPIHSSDIVFPADGRHLGFQNASDISGVFLKGQKWDLATLLGDKDLAERYQAGALVLSRLCPVDYHRFHFPCSGIAEQTEVLNGPLYSVSPIALRQQLSYLWQNKRTLTKLKTPDLGTVLLLEIGATCVGSIQQTYQAGQTINKGDEKGYFAFGGSSTITIFEPDTVRLAEDLVHHSSSQTELYAKMGDSMAKAKA